MEQSDFENFCKNKGFDERTMQVLRKMGVTNGESLCVLTDEDFTTEPDLKQLPLVQRRLLQSVLKELKEKQNQQSDNSHGPPPATSALNREHIENYEYPDELRIVLIGKTGSGKSSTGNTILNLEHRTGGFDPSCGQAAGTVHCQRRSIKINGTKIRLIDTPGVYDPARDEQEVAEEIGRCLMLCSPGPHALLFVCKGHERFTKEEILAYYKLKAMFSSKVTKYVIVVFTGGDVLDEEGKTMEDTLKKAKDAIRMNARRANPPADITEVLKDASNRYTLFSNKGDTATKDQQVLALLDMVMEMVKNNGDEPYFQNETTRTVSDVKEKDLQRIMTENGISRREAEVIQSVSLDQTIVINREPVETSDAVLAGAGIGLMAAAAVTAAPIAPAIALAGFLVAGAATACGAAKEECSVM